MEDTNEKVNNENPRNVEEMVLVSEVDGVTINQICAALDEEKIPYTRIDEGSGSYMGMYMGFSNHEKRIVVAKEDFERAREVVSPLLTSIEEEGLDKEDLPDELKYAEDLEEPVESEDVEKAYKMVWLILVFLTIVIPAIIFLLMAIA